MTTLLKALETDIAITVEQARRHHGVRLEILEHLAREEMIDLLDESVKISKRANISQEVTFVRLVGQTVNLDWRLRHLAALAEIRFAYGIEANDWILRTLENPKDFKNRFRIDVIPDAVWSSPMGVIAVEFDAGSHDVTELRKKMAAYSRNSRWHHQWWFASTLTRAENIVRVLQDSGVHPLKWHVGLVDWL